MAEILVRKSHKVPHRMLYDTRQREVEILCGNGTLGEILVNRHGVAGVVL